jgi:hypothetical protein
MIEANGKQKGKFFSSFSLSLSLFCEKKKRIRGDDVMRTMNIISNGALKH